MNQVEGFFYLDGSERSLTRRLEANVTVRVLMV